MSPIVCHVTKLPRGGKRLIYQRLHYLNVLEFKSYLSNEILSHDCRVNPALHSLLALLTFSHLDYISCHSQNPVSHLRDL